MDWQRRQVRRGQVPRWKAGKTIMEREGVETDSEGGRDGGRKGEREISKTSK